MNLKRGIALSMLSKIQYQIYRFKYRYSRQLKLNKPVDVSLELAALCNQKCSYCYWAEPDTIGFKPGLMTYDTARLILFDAAKLGVNSLKFNYRGESSLNPSFEKITALAKSLARGSTFIERLHNSNFKFRTDREDIFKGFANSTKVKISYDSFTRSVFEKQRAGGDHNITTRNIDKFYNHPARRKSGTKMVIQAVRTQLNKDEDIEGLSKRRWPEAEVSIRDVVAGRVENDEIGDLEVKKRDDRIRVPCIQAFSRLMFRHDGTVGVCCPDTKDKLIIGDIHKEKMWDIFNSQKAKMIRKNLANGSQFLYDPCRTCSSFESYGGFKPSWNS